MNPTIRQDIHIGQAVEVVKKQHQRSGELTWGIVKRILTSAPKHHRGIKVMLQSGAVGRVQNIMDEDED